MRISKNEDTNQNKVLASREEERLNKSIKSEDNVTACINRPYGQLETHFS